MRCPTATILPRLHSNPLLLWDWQYFCNLPCAIEHTTGTGIISGHARWHKRAFDYEDREWTATRYVRHECIVVDELFLRPHNRYPRGDGNQGRLLQAVAGREQGALLAVGGGGLGQNTRWMSLNVPRSPTN
jgi:hypothetical protein